MNDKVEPYVFKPQAEYEKLKEQAKGPQHVPEESKTDPTSKPVEVSESPETSQVNKTLPHGKDLTKRYRAIQLEKVLRDTYGEEMDKFDNLPDLLKCATGRSRKVLKNEEDFFKMAFALNAASALVTNASKICLFYPASPIWYKI